MPAKLCSASCKAGRPKGGQRAHTRWRAREFELGSRPWGAPTGGLLNYFFQKSAFLMPSASGSNVYSSTPALRWAS